MRGASGTIGRCWVLKTVVIYQIIKDANRKRKQARKVQVAASRLEPEKRLDQGFGRVLPWACANRGGPDSSLGVHQERG